MRTVPVLGLGQGAGPGDDAIRGDKPGLVVEKGGVVDDRTAQDRTRSNRRFLMP